MGGIAPEDQAAADAAARAVSAKAMKTNQLQDYTIRGLPGLKNLQDTLGNLPVPTDPSQITKREKIAELKERAKTVFAENPKATKEIYGVVIKKSPTQPAAEIAASLYVDTMVKHAAGPKIILKAPSAAR